MSKAPQNKLEGRKMKGSGPALMTPLTIMAMILIGVFAFAALIVLSGYADNWRDRDNGRAHAFSKSAIGYAGLSKLLQSQGHDVVLSRSKNTLALTDFSLTIITLDRPLSEPLSDEKFDFYNPTLIVMPKWLTIPMREHRGWRRKMDPPFGPVYDLDNYGKALPADAGDVSFDRAESNTAISYAINSPFEDVPDFAGAKISRLQTVDGDNLKALMTVNGRMLLAQINELPVYILSDPDFLNTQGLSESDRATFALDIIDGIAAFEGLDSNQVIFDLTTHGFGTSDNLVKYLLRTPFLAATLCLIAAGILTAWQAFARFGDPAEEMPDYALGKSTLADNAARFIHIAGREARMMPGYIKLTRRRAARDMNIHGHSEAQINQILSRRSETLGLTEDWTTLNTRAENAAGKTSLLMAAKKLYDWKQEISHDRK